MSRRKVEMVSRWRISCSRRLRTGKRFFLLLLSWFLLFHLLMLHVSRSLLLLLVAGGMTNGNYRGRSKHDATSLPDHGCGCGGRGGGVVGWLLMLVGDPMYLAGLTLLVAWGRGEHCELGLVDYHGRTLQYIDVSNKYFATSVQKIIVTGTRPSTWYWAGAGG